MAAAALSDLIAASQQGDAQALAHLTRHIRPLVERQLVRYPLSDEDRRDVLQSTLMQVVRRIDSFRGNANFGTWLFRVTANEALMLMRSQRRHRNHLAADVDPEAVGGLSSPARDADVAGDESTLQTERELHVRDAVAQLPEHYREVVTAHYHHDLGLHEIARLLHVSESAVRSRLHRARSRLRTLLSAGPYAPVEAASAAASAA
ncbi:MAG TPA: sigma-70 family RNA polymerase sigma factor [Polyangiaceae bacterium]|nr:sigma-70 family RNA polymerase sigma factor [Polyangiaceae bacterium]